MPGFLRGGHGVFGAVGIKDGPAAEKGFVAMGPQQTVIPNGAHPFLERKLGEWREDGFAQGVARSFPTMIGVLLAYRDHPCAFALRMAPSPKLLRITGSDIETMVVSRRRATLASIPRVNKCWAKILLERLLFQSCGSWGGRIIVSAGTLSIGRRRLEARVSDGEESVPSFPRENAQNVDVGSATRSPKHGSSREIQFEQPPDEAGPAGVVNFGVTK